MVKIVLFKIIRNTLKINKKSKVNCKIYLVTDLIYMKQDDKQN